MPPKIPPTILVVFGATGDLAQRKLWPAMLDLYVGGKLPEEFNIIGFARRPFSDDEFQNFLRESINQKKHGHDPKRVEGFLSHISYSRGLFDDADAYRVLAETLGQKDEVFQACSNKLFYLAVPPNFYETILDHIAASGLTIPCSDSDGWTRVLIEKPFGKDVDSAYRLDLRLSKLFKESQIFRIDHYLAKEALQNILAFRFANALFENVWDKNYIKKVEIRLIEKIGVEQRGAFYDQNGALRDVGQNHMLQMLAAIAMDHPGNMNADAIRDKRVAVLKALEPIRKKDFQAQVIRGQYQGYRDEPSVASDSETETYFKIKAFLSLPKWRGVPFILESGKKLNEKRTEISLHFREKFPCLCPEGPEGHHHQNILTFRIQPDPGISLLFWVKRPGFDMHMKPTALSFSYESDLDADHEPDAYERVLYDCIQGDQTLFSRTDGVRAAWKFITPIVENWHSTPLHEYGQGGTGPKVEPIV